MTLVVLVEPGGAGAAARGALALAASLGDVEQVIALSAAGARPERRGALGRSIGRDVRIVDPRLDGAAPAALARALAAAARRLGATLILGGVSSDGEGRGIIPACVAHALDAVYLSSVEEVTRTGDSLTVVVRAGGSRCRLAITLPAVLTVAPGSVLPTTAARSATVETLSLADLGIEADVFERDAPLLGALERPRKRPASARSAADLRRRLR